MSDINGEFSFESPRHSAPHDALFDDSIEQRWVNDVVFSQVTAGIADPEIDVPHTDLRFKMLEAGLRALDSPVGEVAAGLAMGGMVAARKVRERVQRRPTLGEETITEPLTAEMPTTYNDLATRIQRSRYLHVTALSESTQDIERLRANTLVGSLLQDAQDIVTKGKLTMSFEEALTAAKNKRALTTHPAFGTALDTAYELAMQRFAEVDAELLFKQALNDG